MHTDDGVMRLLRSSKARCGQRSQSTTNALSGKKLAPSPSRAPRVERTAWEADKKRQRPSSSVWMTSSEFLKLTGCARAFLGPLWVPRYRPRKRTLSNRCLPISTYG